MQEKKQAPLRAARIHYESAVVKVAEGEGFEPSRRLPAYTRSRRAPSTTRPPLQGQLFQAKRAIYSEVAAEQGFSVPLQ